MLRVGAVDCEESKDVCKKNDISGELPLYRVYPELRIPPVDYRTQDLDTDVLKKKAYKFIGNKSIEITSNNFDTFVSDSPGRAKILLVTDKAKTPIVYRALSAHFDVSLTFCYIYDFRKHSNSVWPNTPMKHL